MGYRFDWGAVVEYLPLLGYGLLLTLRIAALSLLLALILGIVTGLMRVARHPLLRVPSAVYVEIVRGVPLLVFLMFLYFGVGRFFDMSPFLASVLGLGLFEAAFVGEVIRAGIEAVPRGQVEAARSTGLTYFQTMRLVVLPQAMRKILPALTGQLIILVKDSSLVMVIGARDLSLMARNVAATTFRTLEVWGTTALIYLAVNLALSRLALWLERRYQVVD